MPTLETAVELLQLFGDPTRVRLLAILSEHELSVAELTAVTDLAQSRVSTHLGKLRDAGLLRDRREGTSTYYSVNDGSMPADARKVWSLLEHEVRDAVLEADRARCAALIKARDAEARWPDALAGQMERHYSPGRTWEATARAFLGLMRLGDVLDGGAGDGTIAQLLAPRAKSITCIDRSEKMVDAARARLAGVKHAHFRVGDLHELPFDARSFDQVLLFNVLTSAHAPARVLAETARVLRAGGALCLVTLESHAHADVTAAYHHVHAGFSVAGLKKMLHAAGLTVEYCDVACREKRQPNFQVITGFARKG